MEETENWHWTREIRMAVLVTNYSSFWLSPSRVCLWDLHAINFILSFSLAQKLWKCFWCCCCCCFALSPLFFLYSHIHIATTTGRASERERGKNVQIIHAYTHQFIRETIKLKTVYAFCTALFFLSFSRSLIVYSVHAKSKLFFFTFICTHSATNEQKFCVYFSMIFQHLSLIERR